MKKILLIIFSLGFIALLVDHGTTAIFESEVILADSQITASSASNLDVRLNEIMPKPEGDDDAPMPNGEWVELYNQSSWPVDVNGWWLYDAIDSHELLIAASNVSGGSTIIPAGGFLVVYRNGDADFSLNDSVAGDTVRLFNGPIISGTLVDSYNYINPINNWVFARIPDGIGSWIASSTPTPGGPNV